MNLLWLLVIVLIVLAIMGVPQVGVLRHGFGYAPSGLVLVLIVVVVVLLLR